MTTLQQINPGTKEYPSDPILYRGSSNKNVLVFGTFSAALSFAYGDKISSTIFTIYERYSSVYKDFTTVEAINYYVLGEIEICEFKRGGNYTGFTYEWKSKFNKEFIDMIKRLHPSMMSLLDEQ